MNMASFERSAHTLTVLPSGESWMPSAETMLGRVFLTLRVAVSVNFAVREVIPRLPEFMQRNPALHIELYALNKVMCFPLSTKRRVAYFTPDNCGYWVLGNGYRVSEPSSHGLLFSQFVTLFLTPVVYIYMEDAQQWTERLFKRKRGEEPRMAGSHGPVPTGD